MAATKVWGGTARRERFGADAMTARPEYLTVVDGGPPSASPNQEESTVTSEQNGSQRQPTVEELEHKCGTLVQALALLDELGIAREFDLHVTDFPESALRATGAYEATRPGDRPLYKSPQRMLERLAADAGTAYAMPGGSLEAMYGSEAVAGIDESVVSFLEDQVQLIRGAAWDLTMAIGRLLAGRPCFPGDESRLGAIGAAGSRSVDQEQGEAGNVAVLGVV